MQHKEIWFALEHKKFHIREITIMCETKYVMRCAICISHISAFVWSFERIQMHANAFLPFCSFYPLGWVSVAF